MQDNKTRKWLYDSMTREGYDLGSYEEFDAHADDATTRKWLYENGVKSGLELGSYEEFDAGMGKYADSSGKQLPPGAVHSSFGEYAAGESGAALYANSQYEKEQRRQAEQAKSERGRQAAEMRRHLEESGQLGKLDEAGRRAQEVIEKEGGDFPLWKAALGVYAIPSLARYVRSRFFNDETRAAYATRQKVEEANAVVAEAGHSDKGFVDKQLGGLARGLAKGRRMKGPGISVLPALRMLIR